MQQQIQEYLKYIIEKIYNIEVSGIELSVPPKKNMWDFAFGCFSLARELKKSPQIIAEDLKGIVEADERFSDFFEKLEIAWPYLNIYISGTSFVQDFIDFLWKKDIWEIQKNKNIIIDYIGANVGKPLHIWHMCTPNQWQVIINVYKKLWYNVISDSHIWDWGIIFWKLICAYQEHWSEEKLQENAVEHLFQLYVKITAQSKKDPELDQKFRDTFKKLAEGNEKLVSLWKNFTSFSIEAMNVQLARLNVFTDYNIWESFYEWIGLPKMENYPDLTDSMHDIVKELIHKNIATQNDDNSVGVVFPDESNISSCILQKRDGTHWYLASDLACIKYRMQNWSPDSILYFNDMRQQLHFRQAFYIATQAGWLKRTNKKSTELTHTYNGFITLKDWAMSTRDGKIIKLDKLLDEAEERAKRIILEKRDDIVWQELDNLAKIIWIGAVKYGYLKKTRESDVVFDWDEFMTFEGNSGPYIQYSFVRAKNILEKAGEIQEIRQTEDIEISGELKNLITLLMQYREILEQTAREAHPHILAGYAYNLAKVFNSVYNTESMLLEENVEYKNFKLQVLKKYTQTLKEAFSLLAIDMPEKM